MNTSTEETPAHLSDTMAIATWNIPRSIEQLRSFVTSREDELDVEDFDL